MSDSFLHNHQAALDSQREEDAIKWSNPDPDIEEEDFEEESCKCNWEDKYD